MIRLAVRSSAISSICGTFLIAVVGSLIGVGTGVGGVSISEIMLIIAVLFPFTFIPALILSIPLLKFCKNFEEPNRFGTYLAVGIVGGAALSVFSPLPRISGGMLFGTLGAVYSICAWFYLHKNKSVTPERHLKDLSEQNMSAHSLRRRSGQSPLNSSGPGVRTESAIGDSDPDILNSRTSW